MKNLLISFIILAAALTSTAVLSQGSGAKTERVTAPGPEKKEPKKETKGNIPAGYGELKWGARLNDAKSGVMGKMVYTDEKRKISTKEGDIEYLYGFFYVDPVIGGQAEPASGAVAADKQTAGEGEGGESSLFYVSVRFPYLTRAEVQKKIEEKYGAPTGEDIVKNQGAVIWDSEKTIIIMWVDNYEKASFCRKINYIGKEIAAKINDYQKKVFNQAEIEILKRLSL